MQVLTLKASAAHDLRPILDAGMLLKFAKLSLNQKIGLRNALGRAGKVAHVTLTSSPGPDFSSNAISQEAYLGVTQGKLGVLEEQPHIDTANK